MIKGVIFDLDGVITDTAKYHYLAWKKIADELGISIDLSFNEKLKGISRRNSLLRILEYGNMEGRLSEERIEYLLNKKNEDYKNYLNELTRADILPGIEDFLIELRDNSIRTAIASASQNAGFILDKLGVSEYIDYVVDAALVKKGKPNPEVFLRAAEGIYLGVMDTVGIEDSEAGVLAMKSCGMLSIGIGIEADYTIHSTAELTMDYIKNLNK